jgi:hypothetical protein
MSDAPGCIVTNPYRKNTESMKYTFILVWSVFGILSVHTILPFLYYVLHLWQISEFLMNTLRFFNVLIMIVNGNSVSLHYFLFICLFVCLFVWLFVLVLFSKLDGILIALAVLPKVLDSEHDCGEGFMIILGLAVGCDVMACLFFAYGTTERTQKGTIAYCILVSFLICEGTFLFIIIVIIFIVACTLCCPNGIDMGS